MAISFTDYFKGAPHMNAALARMVEMCGAGKDPSRFHEGWCFYPAGFLGDELTGFCQPIANDWLCWNAAAGAFVPSPDLVRDVQAYLRLPTDEQMPMGVKERVDLVTDVEALDSACSFGIKTTKRKVFVDVNGYLRVAP